MGYVSILILSWLRSLFGIGKGYIISALGFIWMAYLGGAANPVTTFDYQNYAYYYEATGKGGQVRLEWLYTFLSKNAYYHGFDYAKFRLFLISATFILLFIAASRLTTNLVLFTSFFMVVPFFNEVTQVRSFVAYTLILLGCSFLDEVKVKNIIKYLIFLILAMGFHSSAGLFILIPVVKYFIEKSNTNKVFNVSVITTLGISLLLILSQKISFITVLIGKVLALIAGQSVSNTFINLMANSGSSLIFFLIILVLYLILMFIVFDWNNKFENIVIRFENISSLIIVGLLSTPLLLISDQFQRFQRLGVEGLILLIASLYLEKSIDNRRLRLPYLILSTFVIFVMAYEFYGTFNSSFFESIPYLAHLKK